MKKQIKIGIIGGAGYTGGELIRILLNHPAAIIEYVQSKSNAGNLLSKVHADLIGETNLVFTADYHFNIDLLFLCLAHGEASIFLEKNKIEKNTRVIDLSQDFRLTNNSKPVSRNFIYGLPELNRDAIKTANSIANPGCFATAIQLGLLPLAKEGLLKDVYTTGITGSTGAGQSLSETSHFSWRVNNIQAYKTLSHQHCAEILQSINSLQPGSPLGIEGLSFVPWRGDFARGIFVSSQLKCDLSIKKLTALYNKFYLNHPFVFVSDEPIHLKQVVNNNKCVIQLEKAGNKLVVHTAIDNLLKGASGQAVQNMNLMFGLDETTGLKLKSNYF